MRTLVLLLAFPSLLLFAACGEDEEQDTNASPTRSAGTRAPDATGTVGSIGDGGYRDVCAENPDPATDDLTLVEDPAEGDEVSSPVTVRGRIAAFEAVFKITIYDEDGDVIAEKRSMTAEGATLAPFEEEMPFTAAEETPACLWVYGESGRDGSPDNVAQVPILLLP